VISTIFLIYFNAWHASLGNAILKDTIETILNNWTPLNNQPGTSYWLFSNQDGIFLQLLISQPSEATLQKNLARQPISYQEKTFVMALISVRYPPYPILPFKGNLGKDKGTPTKYLY